ncbi:MAG TPA: dihydrolipoamide acetyltransferase, partial [Rhodoferax sp.]|nr:dihydrolipoamide acetyltransferase [Rhodoferax sp.]
MAILEIKVPDIGDFAEVVVIELLVKAGDSVKAEQSLLTVESDKASMEIPSSHAGVVKELKVQLGDKVSEGSLVLLLDVAEQAVQSVAAAAPASSPAAADLVSNQAVALADQALVAPVIEAVGSQSVELRVPDIGDFKDVTVIEVMVKQGDSIRLEQSLITVESDKASMEIPSSSSGVIKSLLVKLGDKLNIGDLLAIVEAPAAPASAAPASSPAASPNSESKQA